MPNPPRLLDQVREKLRVKHYSIGTGQTYVDWIRRFILFHDKRHPNNSSAPDGEAILTHLAVAGKVAASTQDQARSALLLLYREVWEDQLARGCAEVWLPFALDRKYPAAAARA